ncbi:hypothetical protein GS597_01260 [Synechococcales cyanobacterium C]|uniref:Uncharacterized protein n=1 Tax=Petrachloros mirabilis ULC683 TaxID=2781853 RepID=A0A8K1ZWX6_9CYAN|nr:helix-turn-helix domain-containing protein [Petrachloros mirabilis]NCJ05167.1 hypothetical protein [Petrachloros mirabilis ULC683]
MPKTSKTAIEREQRRVAVLQMRTQGKTIREIAEALGISHGTAHNDCLRALAELKEQQRLNAEEYLQLELVRLDTAQAAIAKQVKAGHLGAIDRWLKISAQRCKLLGLEKSPQTQLDFLTALRVLAENGTLPPQIAEIAVQEMNGLKDRVAYAIAPGN